MTETINGVSPADAQAFYDVVEEACVIVSKRDPNELFDVVKGLDLAIGTNWSPSGSTMTYEAPAKLFADATKLRAALDARTREAKIAAFPALAVLDERRAALLFDKVVRLDMRNSLEVSFEGNLVRAFWMRWKELSVHLPPATLGGLFLTGQFSFSALTDEQVAAIPSDALIEAIVSDKLTYPNSGDGARLLRLHPAFADLDTRGALAERIASLHGHFVRDLFPPLIASLITAKHRSAEPAVLAFFERTGRTFPYGLSLVMAIKHQPTLERLFAELPALAARPTLRFDPHHADRDLAPSIRAGYALDPATSSVRFASYFTPEKVADDKGSKVAWDIWMLGEGRLVDHGGTRLGTAAGKILAADRGWAPIAARLANHPRLEKAARWVVGQTADDPKALIAAVALPATTWPTLIRKAKKPKKAAAKTKAKKASPSKAKAKPQSKPKAKAKPQSKAKAKSR